MKAEAKGLLLGGGWTARVAASGPPDPAIPRGQQSREGSRGPGCIAAGTVLAPAGSRGSRGRGQGWLRH